MLGIKNNDASQPSGDTWIGPAPWIETEPPGPKARALIDRDERFSSPSNTRDYPLVVDRAYGSVVADPDGNRFLDMAAGIAVCATGHCHPKVVAAIHAQSKRLVHICGSDFYYPAMVELVDRLASIVPGRSEKRVLLTNSGAEAVEAAIKLSRFHSGRRWIIAFHGAFHGRTMGALSLTCSKARQREGFGPLVPMVAHVPYGDAGAIESQLFRYQMGPGEVAAIFVEALQGEGGYVVPDASFLPKLRALCDKHGILLVCDEIQSGAGRTGKWFAYQHAGIVPDITLMAKGLASGMPLGAVIARAEVMNWPPGAQGSTFGGNPVCCAAALATLDLVESQYMAHAARLGERLREGLIAIAERRKCVANVRGLGLMLGVDVVNRRTGKRCPKLRGQLLTEAFRRGVLLLGCGETGIRFCPPLCINEAQLDVALKLFDEAVATVV
ncbi:MAG: aminotransferase class III-fold pyridoxal phosphate-dependent enzyme [Phycisphaerae bacterium]